MAKLTLALFAATILISAIPPTAMSAANMTNRERKVEAFFSQKYCPPSEHEEKVGRPPIAPPETDLIRKISTAALSNAIHVQLKHSIAELGAAYPQVANLSAWEVETSSIGVNWLLLNFEVRGGSQPIGFSQDWVTLAIEKAVPANKFRILHGIGRSVNPQWSSSTTSPYAVVDADGDGIEEVLLRQTDYYSGSVIAFAVSKNAWTKIFNGCHTAD